MFRQTLAKIERQPTLARELEKLLEEKDIVENRVEERKKLRK